MNALLSDNSLQGLSEIVGVLPSGDIPAAWYLSIEEEVLTAYGTYRVDAELWRARMEELKLISGFTGDLMLSTQGGSVLVGLHPPAAMTTAPRWWRMEKGLLVPRRRTKAEKESDVNRLWAQLRTIPQPVDYLPGLPPVLWAGDKAYVPQVRKPAQAVLVFLGLDPAKASEPFEVSPAWTKMKLSTFLMLRERQMAAEQVR